LFKIENKVQNSQIVRMFEDR